MTVARSQKTTGRPRPVVYPTSDGKPMAETEKHVNVILDCIQGLRFHLRDRPDAYVAGNNFVYWEEGNPRARVSPDVYVVFGVDKRVRDSFKAWEENGALPAVVIEVSSRATRAEDTSRKLRLYEQTWRTAEYFLFDPPGDYLQPRLQGYRLSGGAYVPIPPSGDRLHSAQLGLDLVPEGVALRLYDPVAGRFLPSLAEAEAQRAEAEAQQAQAEAQQAQAEARAGALEAENERLRAELDALRRQPPRGE